VATAFDRVQNPVCRIEQGPREDLARYPTRLTDRKISNSQETNSEVNEDEEIGRTAHPMGVSYPSAKPKTDWKPILLTVCERSIKYR
jgi:hypothetical protein